MRKIQSMNQCLWFSASSLPLSVHQKSMIFDFSSAGQTTTQKFNASVHVVGFIHSTIAAMQCLHFFYIFLQLFSVSDSTIYFLCFYFFVPDFRLMLFYALKKKMANHWRWNNSNFGIGFVRFRWNNYRIEKKTFDKEKKPSTTKAMAINRWNSEIQHKTRRRNHQDNSRLDRIQNKNANDIISLFHSCSF